MSQREFLLVLAHAHGCHACLSRLLADPAAITRGRSLSQAERDLLGQLKSNDFMTSELLSKATGVTVLQLEEYRDHPVARLRHL